MTRILAIDQGTSSTRGIVFGEGEPHQVASFRHATSHPRPGRVEQDPLELLANIRRAVAAAGPVDAIGLANQGESCLAWDALTGEPLSPVIVWQDSRTAAELAELPPERVEAIRERSGLPADAYFSASKLAWIVRNVPGARSALAAGQLRLGTTDAFFIDRLTGRFVTDRSTASRTGLLARDGSGWDEELCTLFGVPMEALPAIRPSVGDFGEVEGIPLRAAIVDQQAALWGHGCRAPGAAKITFGTGAFALAVTGPEPPADPGGLLPTIAWDLGEGPVFALDGGLYDVGSAVDWAIRAGLATGLEDFAEFEAPPAIARGLVFVPAFSGLAAPLWDRSAAPLILGLAPTMGRRDLCQALLEGIALSAAALFEAMAATVPLAGPVSVDGGLSASPYFARLLASALGREVLVRGFGERTALGVAQLAARPRTLPEPTAPDTTYGPDLPIDDTHRARFADAQHRARAWREL